MLWLLWGSPGTYDTVQVEETEFKRIIRENYSLFNNTDNYTVQNTSYGYVRVENNHPRRAWYAGYDEEDRPTIAEVHDKHKIKVVFNSYRTEDEAKEALNLLKKLTANEWKRLNKISKIQKPQAYILD